jgi:hypothetical protein
VGAARIAQQHRREVLGLDGVFLIPHVLHLPAEGLDLAEGTTTSLVVDAEIGEDLGDVVAENEVHRVEPVRADVGERTQLAAFLRQQPPVVVGVVEQPVLEVAAVDVDDPPELTLGDHCPQRLQRRVEPQVVVDGKHPLGRLHRGHQSRRLLAGHRQRLLADDMLARRQRRERMLRVQPVGRGDMNDVDLGMRDQLLVLEAADGIRDAEPRGGGLGVRVGVADGDHLDAQPLESFDVNRTDEPGADDPCAQMCE